MRLRSRVWPILAFLGLCSSPFTARADQVLVSNLLPDGVVSSNPFSPIVVDAASTWAQEFTSGVSVNLSSIQASLGLLNPGNNGDFSLTASLYQVSNVGDAPNLGTLLGTLSQVGPISTTGFSNVEFDPSGTVALDASRFYWFVLSGSSGDGSGGVSWQFSEQANPVAGLGTLPNYGFETVPPPSPPSLPWSIFPPTTDPATFPFLIQVNGAGGSVPEPSSMILGCIGFSAVLLARRWMSSRRIA